MARSVDKKENLSHHGVLDASKIVSYPNDTIRLLHERSSCRSFENKKIPRRVEKLILEAGDHAPTGGNLQPYSIIKITREESRSKLAGFCGQKFMAEAPMHLLFCIDWRRLQRWSKLEHAPFAADKSFLHFWISFQDVIACAQNICTAADSMGLGSVYIGTVIDFIDETKKMFELPELVFPVVLLCLGYPKTRIAPRRKLGIENIVHDEKYRDIEDDALLKAFAKKYEGQKIPVSDENFKIFKKVCEAVSGRKYAAACADDVRKKGYYNPVQRYFGLHYRADEMSANNGNYIKIAEKSGFRWFK